MQPHTTPDTGKWIEMIRVRSSASQLQQALPGLEDQVGNVETRTPDIETFFLRHALYDGDLAVLLIWRSNDNPHLTREGLLIADRMKTIGCVDHAVWIPNLSTKPNISA